MSAEGKWAGNIMNHQDSAQGINGDGCFGVCALQQFVQISFGRFEGCVVFPTESRHARVAMAVLSMLLLHMLALRLQKPASMRRFDKA